MEWSFWLMLQMSSVSGLFSNGQICCGGQTVSWNDPLKGGQTTLLSDPALDKFTYGRNPFTQRGRRLSWMNLVEWSISWKNSCIECWLLRETYPFISWNDPFNKGQTYTLSEFCSYFVSPVLPPARVTVGAEYTSHRSIIRDLRNKGKMSSS
jgi:hypothetical protein